MDQDGKSNVIHGKKLANGQEELYFDEKDYEAYMEAAQACPVNVIHIRNLKNNKRDI